MASIWEPAKRHETEHSITCYDRVSGEEVWSRFIRGLRWIAVTDRVVVAGLGAGEEPGWLGIDAETGETIWENPSLIGGSPALSPQANVLYSCATECLAVQAEDGVVLWRTPLNKDMGVPAANESSVYVVESERDGQGALYVFDSANGAIRERIVPGPAEGGGFCGTPAVSGDMLFVFGCSENLHAYRGL